MNYVALRNNEIAFLGSKYEKCWKTLHPVYQGKDLAAALASIRHSHSVLAVLPKGMGTPHKNASALVNIKVLYNEMRKKNLFMAVRDEKPRPTMRANLYRLG